jgi:protein-tyrosine phosphatase
LSAGLAAKPGSPLKSQAEHVLREMGVPFHPHASQALTEELVNQAETIYCMTEAHRREVVERFPASEAKTHCLDPEGGDIDEPTGVNLEPFFNCAVQVQKLVRLRLDEAGLGAHA